MKHKRFRLKGVFKPILYVFMLFGALNTFFLYAPAGINKTYSLDFPKWYNFHSEKFDLYYSYREELKPGASEGKSIAKFVNEDSSIKVTLTATETALLPTAKDCINYSKLPEQNQTITYENIKKRGKDLLVGANENHFVACEQRGERWLVLIWQGTKTDFYESSLASLTASKPGSFKQDGREVEQTEVNYQDYNHTQLQELHYFKELGNVKAIYTPPVITGIPAADSYIRKLAAQRGYKLQFVPIKTPTSSTKFNQASAYKDWQKLVAAAESAGLHIGLTSTFRPISEQQTLFLERLNAQLGGASYSQIPSGSLDAAINKTLEMTAPPGYSRHHSGYALDVSDLTPGETGKEFRFTRAYEWLSANSYENSKKFGFIPSYPKGVEAGPEPEAWEYLWLGT
ncbi:MAG: D-alanyl-D-alanine carboxypeptidase family protein [Candidatus Saccharimonadales bacterium]